MTTTTTPALSIQPLLAEFGISISPLDGSVLVTLATDSAADVTRKIDAVHAAFTRWRAASATYCASTRPRAAVWSRSRPARSPRKGWARCRR